MPHIHTDPGQHDFTASAFIFRIDGPEPRIVLHLHRKIKKYSQFGGHIELHESPWATVNHELLEESGYELTQLQLLQPHTRTARSNDAKTHPLPFSFNTHRFMDHNHFHIDIAYAFVTTEGPKHAPAEGESTTMRLCTRNELEQLPTESVPDNVRAVALFAFDYILPVWQTVYPTTFEQ